MQNSGSLSNRVSTNSPSFQFKGTLLSLTVLDLLKDSLPEFAEELSEKVKLAPLFFKNAPIIFSLERPACHQAKLEPFIALCREHGLFPVGIRGGSQAQQVAAEHLGLSVLPNDQRHATRFSESEPTPSTAAKQPLESIAIDEMEPVFLPAKVITTPVRSGQKIYASGTDLIILAPVSTGAEVLADGNIHVYAPLRGRALAGVMGDENAKIFSTCLEAELLSIAGYYKTSEDFRQEFWKKTIHASLEKERLHIQIIDK